MRVITEIKPGHKEIYEDIFNTPSRERADRLRFLAMLGSLVLRGQVALHGGATHGVLSQPLVGTPVTRPDPHTAREEKMLRNRMAKRLVAGLTE
ncbi:MAG: hypothetical protein M0003_10455 [Acidithiobacillus sp.]|nr:hypothetical protein [Acidithiobacillus sp.]